MNLHYVCRGIVHKHSTYTLNSHCLLRPAACNVHTNEYLYCAVHNSTGKRNALTNTPRTKNQTLNKYVQTQQSKTSKIEGEANRAERWSLRCECTCALCWAPSICWLIMLRVRYVCKYVQISCTFADRYTRRVLREYIASKQWEFARLWFSVTRVRIQRNATKNDDDGKWVKSSKFTRVSRVPAARCVVVGKSY